MAARILAPAFVLGLTAAAFAAPAPFTELSPGTHAADPWAKCMVDLNGDGRDDLVIGASFGPQQWWESQAGDTWITHTLDTGGGTESAGWCDDIDGDGDIDVLIGGTLYLNPGGAAVTSAWPNHVLQTGRAYHDARMVDLDGDGKTDVIARNESAAAVDIYYQDSPTSWQQVSVDPGFGNNGVESFDVDGDGSPDIVTARHWMKNPGTRLGVWTAYNFNSSWDAYAGITHADMNGDGRRDIVMTVSENTPGRAAWFANPPDPVSSSAWAMTFISPDTLDSCHSVWVTDVDGDGNNDVFTSEFRTPYRVMVFYGNANGSLFTAQTIANTEVHSGAIGDYDGDGDIDYFGTLTFGTGPITLFRNDRAAGPATLPLDNWTYIEIDNSRPAQEFGLAWGDIDGDGDLDVAAGQHVYTNPGGDMSAPWTRTTLPTGADANFIVDVDGDGLADILAQALPNIYWFEATDAAATSYTATVVATGIATTSHGSSQGYAWGEVADGGLSEYMFTHGSGIAFLQIPANPDSGNWPLVSVTSQAPEEGVALGDIDGDGFNDAIAWVGTGSGSTTLGWWKNPDPSGGPWAQYDIGLVGGTEGDRIAVGDFDDDGALDVVATGTTNAATGSALYWFTNPGNPLVNTSWTRNDIALNLGAMNSMDAADMDNDGDIDVVTGEHRGSLDVTVWENVNGSSWIAHLVGSGRENHLGARLVDLDQDGDLDILGIAWDDFSKLHLWRNDASGAVSGSCGDGALDAGEACDDGGVDTALCDANCTLPSCGDSYVNVVLEECDGGGIATATCDGDCSLPVCDDGTINVAAGEQCETGDDVACPGECSACRCPPPVLGPMIAHWAMDEGAGDQVFDTSGSGLHGTRVGATWTSGRIGSALSFDGVDDHVDVSSLSLSGAELSVALWFRVAAFTVADARLLAKATGTQAGDHDLMLSTVAAGGGYKLRIRLTTGGSTTTLVSTGPDLIADTWVHAVLVYDGSDTVIYQDGILHGSIAQSGTLSDAAPNTWIGRNPDGYGPFDGSIDDVRIFSYALSAAEVIALTQTTVFTCGDGQLQGAETCEAPFGDCCEPTTCTFIGLGASCRASAGDCDAEEVCSGSSATCPADAALGDGSACATGVCVSGVCETTATGGCDGVGCVDGDGCCPVGCTQEIDNDNDCTDSPAGTLVGGCGGCSAEPRHPIVLWLIFTVAVGFVRRSRRGCSAR